MEGPGFQPSKEGEFCQYPWPRDPEAIRGTVFQVGLGKSGEAGGRGRQTD